MHTGYLLIFRYEPVSVKELSIESKDLDPEVSVTLILGIK